MTSLGRLFDQAMWDYDADGQVIPPEGGPTDGPDPFEDDGALRSRAAVAAIDLLLAFNPHQRRGPDGKFIKMGTGERRGRARRSSRASAPAPTDHAAQARLREEMDDYHAEMWALGQAWVDMLKDNGDLDPELADAVQGLKKGIVAGMPDQADRNAQRVRELLIDGGHQNEHDLPVVPTLEPAGPAIQKPPQRTTPALISTDAPYAQRWLALQQAATQGVWSEDHIGQGIMGDTRRILFKDGTPAIAKRAKGDYPLGGHGRDWSPKDQTDAEELAAVTGGALGLRAPAVSRVAEDEIHMEYVEGARPAQDRFFDRDGIDWLRVPDDILGSDDGFKMGLFDTLIDNPDRHGYNWMVDDQDRIYPIDHGLSFTNTRGPLGSAASRSPFAREYFVDAATGRYKENSLTPRDIQYISEQIEAMRPEFERLGRDLWHDVMRIRLNQLSRLAKGRVNNFPAPQSDTERR